MKIETKDDGGEFIEIDDGPPKLSEDDIIEIEDSPDEIEIDGSQKLSAAQIAALKLAINTAIDSLDISEIVRQSCRDTLGKMGRRLAAGNDKRGKY